MAAPYSSLTVVNGMLDTTDGIKGKKDTKWAGETKNKSASRSVETMFRNALRSNLVMTALADNKANIMISVNGFILTVIVTAGSYLIHSIPVLIYPFSAVLITSLASISAAIMAVRPRMNPNDDLENKPQADRSVLYFKNMEKYSPDEYVIEVKRILKDGDEVHSQLIQHLYGSGLGIGQKFTWLRWSYLIFTVGLLTSGVLFLGVMIPGGGDQYDVVTSTVNSRQPGFRRFSTIYEPSGVVQLDNGMLLVVEDEKEKPFVTFAMGLDEDATEFVVSGEPSPGQEKSGFEDLELDDLEGLARGNDGFVYAISSHARTKSGVSKPDRERLLRFKVKDNRLYDIKEAAGIKKGLEALHPVLLHSIHNVRSLPLGGGLNIEGLEVDPDTGNLLIGLRRPIIDGKAPIAVLKNPVEVFKDGVEPEFGNKLLLLDLEGEGIRGMTFDPVLEGYLIIGGPAGEIKGSFRLWFWQGGAAKPRRVSIEGLGSLASVEGIASIKDHGGRPAILMVSDDGIRPDLGGQYIRIHHDQLRIMQE
jgi:hypothetical protein